MTMTGLYIGNTNFTTGGQFGSNGRGVVAFHFQQERDNGAGGLVKFGEQWLEWNWAALSLTEWAFLLTCYAANPTTFGLPIYDTDRTPVAFTSGNMHQPVHNGIIGNNYVAQVHVEFHDLMPFV
jgi:hypothetical protein